jgi:hypothetical protein
MAACKNLTGINEHYYTTIVKTKIHFEGTILVLQSFEVGNRMQPLPENTLSAQVANGHQHRFSNRY